jgi:prepilin-type N-terminal cleavage/methylation domain-containing protein
MRLRRKDGFTLLEALLALGVASIIMAAIAGSAVVVSQTITPSGFATLPTGEVMPVAPSSLGEATSRMVLAAVSNAARDSTWCFTANFAANDAWAPPAQAWTDLMSVSATDLLDPALATQRLLALRTPVSAGIWTGKTVFFIRSNYSVAGMLVLTTETYPLWTVHTVAVRGSGGEPLAKYRFAEVPAYAQSASTVEAVGRNRALQPYLIVTLADPALPYSLSAQRLQSMGGDISLLPKTSSIQFVLPCVN